MRVVLRLRPGDTVLLFDDGGNEHEGVVTAMKPTHATVTLTRSYKPARESPLAITLAQAIPKGARMDLAVEKATELGVSRIIPFTSRYTAVREPKMVGRDKLQRWRRIALAAAKQSGRTVVPEVAVPCSWPEVIASAQQCAARLILDPARRERLGCNPPIPSLDSKEVLVAIGPEGGFSQEETAQAEAAGFRPVTLGARILRSETAGIVAVAACELWWGDMK